MPKNKKQKVQNSTIPNILPLCAEVQFKLPLHLQHKSDSLQLLQVYLKAKIMKKGRICKKEPIAALFLGKEELFHVLALKKQQNQKQDEEADDNEILQMTSQTKITFSQEQLETEKEKLQQVIFYGNFPQYEDLKSTLVKNLLLKQSLIQCKLGPIKGVLLGGGTGTGKTTYIKRLQKQIRNEKIFMKIISSTQLLSKVVGGAQEYVRQIFKQLRSYDASCLVIEDMHLIFGEKEISSHETTLGSLFSEMQKSRTGVVVVGTYNSERDLTKKMYQSGRFEKHISLNLPNHYQRLEILLRMIENLKLNEHIPIQQLKEINLRLNGFNIGQIKQFLRDAFITFAHSIDKSKLESVLKKYKPADIQSLIVQVPEVFWSHIGGYEHVKKSIKKATYLPLQYPEKFKSWNIEPSKGVLLYGPPGCSKTMMAKAIATESKLNFIGIKGPQLFSKYVGDSEKAIRTIFRKARAFSPCIIFFDEIDALASQRSSNSEVSDRVLCQLLSQMDGIQGLKQVIIIAATNRPQILDKALTRPGRFDELIYVSPPDFQARKQIFKIGFSKTPLEGQLEKVCEALAGKTENYTGAQISLICREAAMNALEEDIEAAMIVNKDIEKALGKIKNRLTADTVKKYEEYSQNIDKKNTSIFF